MKLKENIECVIKSDVDCILIMFGLISLMHAGSAPCDRTAQNNSVLSPKPVPVAIKQ
jgi:hypothetical protein